MAYGLPVVTSRGSATEEIAGGAAVLVDPLDVDSIAGRPRRRRRGRPALDRARIAARAAALTWDTTADATVAAYREAIG